MPINRSISVQRSRLGNNKAVSSLIARYVSRTSHRKANLRKRSASLAPRQHHDRPDGHRMGARSGAIRGDIWRPTFVGPLCVPAQSGRVTLHQANEYPDDELHADAYANTENGPLADNPARARARGLWTEPVATASLAPAAAGHDCHPSQQN